MNLIFYVAEYGDWLDKLIALVTRGRFSHVELQFSDGVCFSSSPRDGGTRLKTIVVDPLHWVTVPVTCTTAQETKAMEWCEKNVGKGYDYLGVVGLGIGVRVENRPRMFCVDATIDALNYADITRLNDDISPVEMAKIFGVT